MPSVLGIEPDREQHVRALDRRGRRRSARARRRRRASIALARAPFSRLTPRVEERVLEHRRDLGVLDRQHLLARHEQRDLRAERVEQVGELDAGDARPDHDRVLGDLGRRVRVAGGEHALAVDGREVGHAWPRAGGDDARSRPSISSMPAVGVDDDLVRAREPAGAVDHPHPCDSSRLVDRLRAGGPRSTRTRSRSASTSRWPSACEAHRRARGRARPARRRWRSAPSTGCSPRGARRRR